MKNKKGYSFIPDRARLRNEESYRQMATTRCYFKDIDSLRSEYISFSVKNVISISKCSPWISPQSLKDDFLVRPRDLCLGGSLFLILLMQPCTPLARIGWILLMLFEVMFVTFCTIFFVVFVWWRLFS
ncbi:hypothetical protein CDAR_392781 [Caerostris darwini]|uniref:Uncharacterized protein n=1 Tax=Caerostris darwini TaxID=1538125 RepID=A0AAV4S4D3_9ARAC|nr:hypothetical protein CDAR_392781 [Caerostris darwini]